jgi:hypothetical protein
MAIGFNVSVAIFGGTAPLVATLLIKITGDNQAPAFYLIGASVLNLAVLSRIPESHRTDIGWATTRQVGPMGGGALGAWSAQCTSRSPRAVLASCDRAWMLTGRRVPVAGGELA